MGFCVIHKGGDSPYKNIGPLVYLQDSIFKPINPLLSSTFHGGEKKSVYLNQRPQYIQTSGAP